MVGCRHGFRALILALMIHEFSATTAPSTSPSTSPSTAPSSSPTNNPTLVPSCSPTGSPFVPTPTGSPETISPATSNPTPRTYSPSQTPSQSPSQTPVTQSPSCTPTSKAPTITRNPTASPNTIAPTITQQIITDVSSLSITEGGTSGTIGVKLARAPGPSSVTLYINPQGSQLTASHIYFYFTPSSFSSYQYFTVQASADKYAEGIQTTYVSFNLTGGVAATASVPVHISDDVLANYVSFTPALGWMTGGAEVTVTMNETLVNPSTGSVPTLNCVFGNQRVTGTLEGTTGVKCTAPSCQLANNGVACAGTLVSMPLSVEVSNLTTGASLFFSYMLTPSVNDVSPSSGDPCCDENELATVRLSHLASQVQNIDSLAFCKFGLLTSKASYDATVGGTSFTCNIPVRYDLNGKETSDTVDVQITLNGQQYTTSGGSYTYQDSQVVFDALVMQWLLTIVGVLVGSWLIFGGAHMLFCSGKNDKRKGKSQEPTGATELLEHISKDLLRESIEKLPDGENIISSVELLESKPWDEVKEVQLWKRILSIRCSLSVRALEFEMAKPFSELDCLLADAWLFLFKHEFDQKLAKEANDLNEKGRLGPFGHWPIFTSKALEGYMSKNVNRRKETIQRVQEAGDSTISMGMQISFLDPEAMMKGLANKKLCIRAKANEGEMILSECRVEEQLQGGTLQMKQLTFNRSSIENLNSPIIFELAPVHDGLFGSKKGATITVGTSSPLNIESEIGDDERNSSNPSSELKGLKSDMSDKDEKLEQKKGLLTEDKDQLEREARRTEVVGKCTVSFYDLYDMSAAHRRMYGASGKLERLPIATVTFNQSISDIAGAVPVSPAHRDPREGKEKKHDSEEDVADFKNYKRKSEKNLSKKHAV
mmetsp:Transcript_34255/g.55554  ORF Transcript_34255/g.55554 Transcript_34255/m.55554 type:complete len:882 (+) Transcript_34255:60-2705(+)